MAFHTVLMPSHHHSKPFVQNILNMGLRNTFYACNFKAVTITGVFVVFILFARGSVCVVFFVVVLL